MKVGNIITSWFTWNPFKWKRSFTTHQQSVNKDLILATVQYGPFNALVEYRRADSI